MNFNQLSAISAIVMGDQVLKNFGIDVQALMEEAMKKNEDLDPVEQLTKSMVDIQDSIMNSAPLFIRFNMLSHNLQNAKEKNLEGSINWDVVNDLLTRNRDQYDFNCFNRITSIDEFHDAAASCRIAEICDIQPFQKHICKQCGEEFYLFKKEVNFFKDKELHIPKRCRNCRKGIKKDDPKLIKNNESNEPAPTAMELAMKKSGIIK